MKKYLILSLLIVISCTKKEEMKSSNEKNTPNAELSKETPQAEKENSNKKRAPIKKAVVKKKKSFIDKGVAGLLIRDEKSVLKTFGEKFHLKLDSSSLPKLTVCNKDRSQTLKIITHPGAKKNHISEFEISLSECDEDNETLKVKNFVTVRKIKLGISNEDLFRFFGEPTGEDFLGETTKVLYESYASKGEPNYLYYGKYTFKEGKLKNIKFGYSTP